MQGGTEGGGGMSYKNRVGLIMFLMASFSMISVGVDIPAWQQVIIGIFWFGGMVLFFLEDAR